MKRRADFSTDLAYWMWKHRLSGVEVARILGCHPSEISRFRTGNLTGRNRIAMSKRIADLVKRPPPGARR